MDTAARFLLIRTTCALLLAAAAALQTTVAAQTSGPPRTVPFVDLDRYTGDWFEIARLPNRFQRECVGEVRASYARRPDGRLDVINQCRTSDGRIEARGVARVVDDRTFARLKVRFAPAWLTWLPAVWGTTGSSASPMTIRGRWSGRPTASTCGSSPARHASMRKARQRRAASPGRMGTTSSA